MKEIKEKANPIVQLHITNPSVEVLRCSMQVVSITHEVVNKKQDKNGNAIRENLHHYTLAFSQDSVDALRREGKLE